MSSSVKDCTTSKCASVVHTSENSTCKVHRIILVINITLDCVVVLLVPTEVIWCIVARCRCSCYVWAVDSTHMYNIR